MENIYSEYRRLVGIAHKNIKGNLKYEMKIKKRCLFKWKEIKKFKQEFLKTIKLELSEKALT